MKRIGLGLILALMATTVTAQQRPSTPDQFCSVSQQAVTSRGQVVLGTGGFTYDRFVRDRSFCEFDETTEPAWVPSRDTPSCFVGYRCKSIDRLRDN